MAKSFRGKGYRGRLDLSRLLTKNEDAGKRGLKLAAAFLEGQLKFVLSKPSIEPTKLRPAEKRRRAKLIAEAGEVRRASALGEPPRLRTGTLRSSIGSESLNGGLVQRVGTPLSYGFWLEFGTRFMAARPWLRSTLATNKARIGNIVVTAIAKAKR